MQRKLRLKQSAESYQQVFEFQSDALASLERKQAEQTLSVFDQAWANRLWQQVPMLPTRPESGWRHVEISERRDLQNTFQLNALAIDMGVERHDLAIVSNFGHFKRRAKAGVRLFDVRIGPPWWISDREFLEAAYVASQEQELPDQELSDTLECYWGDCAKVPYWVAQCAMDNIHAGEADIMGQVRSSRSHEKWDNAAYRAHLLLNWQVEVQPLLAYEPDYECYAGKRAITFPHQAELKKLIRLLNLKPRGRPQRNLNAVDAVVAPASSTPAVARKPHHADALR